MRVIILYLQPLKATPCLLTLSRVSLEFLICILKLVQYLCHINFRGYFGTVVCTKYFIKSLFHFVQAILLFSIVGD